MQIERELKEKEIIALFDALGVRFQAISEIGLAGTAYPPYWEWSRIVQEYRNWNSPQTMELLTKDAQKALDHFVSWFISLRESIEFRIDSVYGSGISE